MAVSVTSAATMQNSLGRLLPSRPEQNGHRHSPSPPWLQRRQSEEEEDKRREVEEDEEEEEDDKKIPRRQKFSDARAFFERQERLATTCQLASPTGSGPRAKRSRVNEMAKLFQVGRPIPVEEFVVDLDTALPDGSPEIERKDFVPEQDEISRVDKKEGDGSSQDRTVDPEVLSILLQAAVERPKSPPDVDTSFEAPSCVAKRTSSTGVATLASVSPQLPVVSPPPTLPPTSLPDSDTEGEAESARPPVEGQEDLSEETATFYTAKETLSELPESQRTTVEEDIKDDGEEEQEAEAAKEEVKPLKGILTRRGNSRVGVVKLVSSPGKAPVSLPQPQHLTISSSTESLLDDDGDGDEYQDVPVTDTSDEETNDYERLTDCISNAPAIGVDSFSGLVDEESVPNIDDGVPEHQPAVPSVTVISCSERVVVPRAKEVAVEKGVHYLEDGNFFYEMEPRSPSESDEDEALDLYSQYGPPVTPPHAHTRIRFSDDPLTVYSTHSPSEYNRRNELIDPISANAEYELEKQLARMNVFPVRLNKGLRGLGISIMGVGLGRAPGVEKLGIFIKGISAGGPAERDGQLQVLDQIVEVNGRSLVGVTQAEAAEVLRNTHGEVRFLIGREKPELKGLESGGCSIVRLVERSIQQQAMAMRHEEEREEREEEENRLRAAPLAEVEDLRSPCDRSPSQPNKTFLPEERQNGSPAFSGDLMARLRELETENARMQMALEELHEKMAHEDGVEANERLAAMQDRLVEVEQREKEVRRERDSLERELKAKEKTALQNMAEGKERETLLQQQISNLKNDLENSQSRVSALRFENDELSIQLKEAEEKLNRISDEMNEKVRRMESELELLRPQSQNHSSFLEPSDDGEIVSLDAPESSSIIDVSAERHRASLVSSSSLAGRRRPSKGRVVSAQNDEVLFGVPESNGTDEDDLEDDDVAEGEVEGMAEVFTSHGPDSTLSRGPRGGVPLLPGGGDILSMMRDKKTALRRDQTSQEVEDELVNESKNAIYTLDLGDVNEWSTEEVCSHFRNNGFAWLEAYVRQNGVDGERLLCLDSADMKSMGISSSTDRSKFKKKIKELSKAMSKQRAIL